MMAGIDAGGERRAGRQPRADRRAAAQRTFTIISDGEPGWSLAMAGVVAIARGWLPVDEGADLVIIDGRAGLRVPAPSMGAAYRLLVVGRLDDAAVAAVAA
ncbi:MAG: hypothetical protein WCH74_14180, partial [Chloroflexota bacterium]